ncbi:hypothetical protein [Maricaulis salignorans]|uniref:Uncharacterized protein n=1 Tax=Maricaulis salignorans TaxID=144026 RepID=A0A1G9U9F0_9PROT|nr:hypothetical protein [Maricaulis salignorans]SDM56570.1 hypothetical protein SAMN04488568_11450 [Maricaulis salignorans]
MRLFGEHLCGYPFAIDLFLDGYEGPGRFLQLFKRQSGWLKAFRVSLETPIGSWEETRFACLTDAGYSLSSYPASCLLQMPMSLPTEVEHTPPEELDELVDGLYWDFLGLCDRRCQRILDHAHLDADKVVEQHERDLNRLSNEIDRALQMIRRDMRYSARQNDRPILQRKAERLQEMARQLPDIFRRKMRAARHAVDAIEDGVLESTGAKGEIDELYTVYFRVKWQAEPHRTIVPWLREGRTHVIPWNDERQTLIAELQQTSCFVPNKDRTSNTFYDRDLKAAAQRVKDRKSANHKLATTKRWRWKAPADVDSTSSEVVDEHDTADASLDITGEGLSFSRSIAPDAIDLRPEIAECDQQQVLDALTGSTGRVMDFHDNPKPPIDEAAFQEILQRDAERELQFYFDQRAARDADADTDDD